MTPTLRSTFAAFALLLTVAPATAAAAAIPEMRFSVRPDPAGSLSEGGDYFVVGAAPGEVVSDALEVSNHTERPVTVRLAPVDAATAQLGGVDYSASGVRPQKVGSWIDLAESSVTLPPRDARLVRFEVTVPEDVPSGVNLGGIAAWTPAPGAGAQQDEGLDAAIEVQTRRVVAVQVELPGPREPLLEIDGVSAIARPDGTYLQIDVRNEGHDFALGEGTIELDDGFSHPFALDKVVPGTGVGYPVRWRGDAPAAGSYDATVEIDYGSGVAEWEGTVLVGDAVREELADRGIGGGAQAFPLVPVGGALLVLGLAAASVTVRRRRRRNPSPPAPPAPPAPRSAPPPPPPPPAAARRPSVRT